MKRLLRKTRKKRICFPLVRNLSLLCGAAPSVSRCRTELKRTVGMKHRLRKRWKRTTFFQRRQNRSTGRIC
ncbi:hypothetical protein L596_024870 [Steinernema carpocapsae]|uniref:Uncharacterized protein n=1 Tax=Steinernema carpocapsae TaxID=34508 RepID=A0A4U5M622_STECR|nr:hypothetical protein L596_024870 [Steinernema carpocapsae]